MRWMLGADAKVSIFFTAGLGIMPHLRTRCRCPIPLETLERTIGEAKTSRIMRGKFVSNNLLTKSKVPALVYLDQFLYLGFFENEK